MATLLSSLYPQTHGVRDQGGRINREATDTLSDEAHTLAEVFQNAGYDTAAFRRQRLARAFLRIRSRLRYLFR